MMAAMLNLRFHSVFFKPSIFVVKHKNCLNLVDLRTELGLCSSFRKRSCGGFVLQALSDSGDEGSSSDDTKRIEIWGIAETTKKNVNFVDLKHRVLRFRQAILSLPPVVFVMRSQSGSNFALGSSVLATLLVVLMRVYVLKKLSNSRPGTVADLVRRGQLRYDRRGISTPLKFDDPFNNPMVKVVKGNSTVEMCGKVYRLAPVTLTKEQQATHQKRRSRAYQWKRPTTFLREGDPIPLDVDPDTIRWIPANHPFATTATDIDESLAQTNVYQKHGVPFRIQAEHEALQRKLEALQSDQKLSKLVIDPGTAKDFGRPFKSHVRSDDQSDDQCVEMNPSNGHPGGSVPEHTPNSSVNCSTFEDLP